MLHAIGLAILFFSEPVWAGANDDEPLLVNNVKVKIVDTPNDQRIYKKIAQRLIRIESGDQLSPAKIKASLDALALSERFATIHVDTVSMSGGEDVIFTLTPYRFIKEIKIYGNYPLFEKDVLNQMTIFSGDVFRSEDLPKQATAIADRFRREGYVAPEVDVTAENGTKTGDVTIRVKIRKGASYQPGRLTITGNQAIGVTSLKPRMKTWRMGLLKGITRFTETRLKDDIDRLKDYYRRKGYCEVEITSQLDKKSRFPKVDVELSIFEGPRYKIAFEGNTHFWNYTLKKDVVIFKEGNRRGLGLRKSIKNIKQRYLNSGFMDPKVVARRKTGPDGSGNSVLICFEIEEGPRTIVSEVILKGNGALTEKMIRKQILTDKPGWFHSGAFNQETLNEDIFAVRTLYLNKGFQDVEVDHRTAFTQDRGNVAVAIDIREGRMTRIGSVAIAGSDLIALKDVKTELSARSGRPFRKGLLKSDESFISGQISEKGYPHVIVKSRVELNADHTRADVTYEIDSGPKVYLGEIFVSGNLKTKERIILRELGIKPEEPLSLQKMVDGQRALRDLDIFRSVQYKSIGLKEREESVNLFVEVEERKPYYAQASLGYRSDKKQNASVKLGDNNFLGLNKSVSAYGEVSATGYQVESMISEPRLFGSKTSANLGVYDGVEEGENKGFETHEYGASLGFGREWTPNLDSTLSFVLRQIKTTESSSQTEPPFRTVCEVVPGISFDNRDSFIKPTRGGVVSLAVNINKGFENSNDDLIKYRMGLSYYITPIERITLAWQARLGHIQPYGGNKSIIPGDQLFYLGGTNDVRGFEENLLRRDGKDAVGGRTSISGSLEIRLDLGRNWELATFYDAGSVQNAIPDPLTNEVAGSDDFRSSIGIGLRYITPIGPIGMLYGHILDKRAKEDPGRWHFSIGYTF